MIRIRCAGICNTDVEILKGYMGFSGILGHEFTGVVVLRTSVPIVLKVLLRIGSHLS